MRRVISAAFRRRVKSLEADIVAGTFFKKNPTITAGDVMWLANDTQYLGILRTHEAFEAFFNMGNLHRCASNSSTASTPEKNALWTRHSSDVDIALAYKAVSSLHPSLRSVPRVLEALGHLNNEALERVSTMSAWTATAIIKQIPTLQTNARTLQVGVAVCNHWLPKLTELPHVNDARAFLQTIGSQFTRPECAGILCELNIAALERSLVQLLSRRDEIRRLAPTIMTTFSKLHCSGFPLSSCFDHALQCYMTHIVRKRGSITTGEALRVLSAISRIRLHLKSSAYTKEANELLEIASKDVSAVDGPELAMLMSCLAFHFQNVEGDGASPSTSTPTLRPEVLLSRMTSLVDVLSLRGFISCCRSAALLGHANQIAWDSGLCDAVLRRCKAMLLNEPDSDNARTRVRPGGAKRTVIGAVDCNSLLFEKLTVLVAANPFASKTPYSRATVHHLIATLLQQHPYELTATNLSLMFSSLASAFGVPVGSGEIQTAPGRPPIGPSAVRRQSHVHEINPVMLSSLIDKAGAASKMSQYAYSTLLRNFCRLGLEYAEVAVVASRVLTMRYEGNRHHSVVNEDSLHHRGASVNSSPSTDSADSAIALAANENSADMSWDRRSRGLYLMSPHMSEIVLASLVGLRCSNTSVLAYVAWSVMLHSGGAVPVHLEATMQSIAADSPLVDALLKNRGSAAPSHNHIG